MRETLRYSLVLVLLLATGLSGCTEYWWQRGQPPGVEKLLKRSQERLASSLTSGATQRPDVAPVAEQIQTSLNAALSAVAKGEDAKGHLSGAADAFLALEGKLSPGSRPAYGELSGQLRVFNAGAPGSPEDVSAALGLFAARTFFFLSNELTVPYSSPA